MQALPKALEPFSAYRQFMLYKTVPSNRPGKMDKLPVSLATGDVVAAHDSMHWVGADEAIAAAARRGAGYGVAFVFTEADPFFFLDVDGCLQADGTWSPLVATLLTWFPGCAVEVSQSGKGLHIFGTYTGQLPEHACKNIPLGLEFYHSLRFVALTGNCNDEGSAAQDCTGLLPQFISAYFPPAEYHADADWTTEPRDDWQGPEDDATLLDKAMASRSMAGGFGRGKACFADLFEGREEVLAESYPSSTGDAYDRSSADAALAQHLMFWTGCDCERAERLMRQSALAREKWDVRSDYLPDTVLRAKRLQKDVYRQPQLDLQHLAPPVPAASAVPLPPGVPAPPESMPDESFNRDLTQPRHLGSDPFLPVDRQRELFEGCVYVLDRHAILTPWGLLDQGRFNVIFGGYTYMVDSGNRRTERKAWACFTESKVFHFPRVHSTCFRPEHPPGHIVWESNEGGAARSRVNTYRPIETLRIAGDPTPFLRLLVRLLPDERDRRILLSYLAACLRYKGRKFQWWPVLQGVQGNGKTFIISAMRHAIGEQYCFAPSVKAIMDSGNKFNSWIEDRLFIAMEEVYAAERRSFLEDFKASITNEWLPIERKGVDQVMGDNRANGIMATNHRDGVPVTTDQRRYCIFYTAQQTKADLVRDGLDGDFFPDLYDWAKGQGRYADLGAGYGWGVIHDYLATYEIDPEFDPAGACQTAPSTSSSVEAVRYSLGGVEQNVLEAIAQGRQGFCGGWVSSVFLDKLMEELRVAKAIPPQKRRELMQSIGYDWHPGLPDGRVNNPVLPDNSKPRLYVELGSTLARMTNPAEIARLYTAAQTGLTGPST